MEEYLQDFTIPTDIILMKLNPLKNPAIRRSIYSILDRYNPRKSNSIASLSGDYITKELLSSGWYEMPFLLLLEKLLKKSMIDSKFENCAIDIGANIGNHSLFLSGIFDKVLAVEPNPICVNLMKATKDANLVSNILIIPKGVGDVIENKDLMFNEAHTGGGTFLNSELDSNARRFNVEIDTVDNIVSQHAGNNSNIRFIKIDAEGFETNVINGAKQTLKLHSPLLAFEAHGKDNYDEVSNALAKEGYKSFYRLIQSRRMYKSFMLNALNMLLRPNIIKIEKINCSQDTNYQMVLASKDKDCKHLDQMNGLFIG